MAEREAGRLCVIATPIGNLEDVTLRALRVLRACDRVYAEDTRRTRVLLTHHGIDKPMVSLHEHNEEARVERVLGEIEGGAVVALVTDAGTPAVSDPGFPLIRAVRAAGLAVEVVPGASAVLTALVGAGLPTDAFAFLGFPPRKGKERAAWLDRALGAGMTVVLYESPHRIADTLGDLAERAPVREAVVARELTKLHEEWARGTLAQLARDFAERASIKGEITLVIAGGEAAATAPEVDVDAEIVRMRGEGMRDADIAKALAKTTGRSRNELYAELVRSRS